MQSNPQISRGRPTKTIIMMDDLTLVTCGWRTQWHTIGGLFLLDTVTLKEKSCGCIVGYIYITHPAFHSNIEGPSVFRMHATDPIPGTQYLVPNTWYPIPGPNREIYLSFVTEIACMGGGYRKWVVSPWKKVLGRKCLTFSQLHYGRKPGLTD